MRRFVLCIALGITALPALPAAAAEPGLDLRAAVRFALEHDPGVLSRRATLAQEEATFARDHAAEFPSLAGSLTNQVSKSNGNTGGAFSQFGLSQATVFSQNTAQVGSTYTLYNGSLAQIDAQQAKRRVASARFDEHRAEQQLAGDVATAWYAAVQQREALRLAQGNRSYQQQLLDAARVQERVGRAAGVDVLRAQVNELQAEATLSSAQGAEINAREALAQRIGASPDTAFALPAALPEPALPTTPLPALVAAALAARPDLAAAAAQVAVARLSDAAIESDRRPQIQLTGGFGHQETPTTQNFSGLGVSRTGPGFWQIGATSSLTLPLLDYGSRRAAHAAARAQIAAADAAFGSTRGAVETDVRQALRAAQTANANLAFARQGNQLGAESARIAQLQYRNGLTSLTDATQAQQSALQAASDLVNARVNYLDALVRLRIAVGVSDPLAVAASEQP